jgi:hypothetical protein
MISLCCITSILLSKWFLINLVVGILMIEYALYKTRSVRKVNEARDSKYSAFRRWDVKEWKRHRLYLLAPLTFPRFFICVSQLFYELPLSKLVILIGGHVPG